MQKVTAAVIERDGKILIARRKRDDSQAGKWEFPGGKLEAGETPEACLKRELREELGIETEVGAFLCSSRFVYPHMAVELLVYRTSYVSGEIALHEHDRVEWVAPKGSVRLIFPRQTNPSFASCKRPGPGLEVERVPLPLPLTCPSRHPYSCPCPRACPCPIQ